MYANNNPLKFVDPTGLKTGAQKAFEYSSNSGNIVMGIGGIVGGVGCIIGYFNPLAGIIVAAVGLSIFSSGFVQAAIGQIGSAIVDDKVTKTIHGLEDQKESIENRLHKIEMEKFKIDLAPDKAKSDYLNNIKETVLKDWTAQQNSDDYPEEFNKFKQDLENDLIKNGEKYFSDYKVSLDFEEARSKEQLESIKQEIREHE